MKHHYVVCVRNDGYGASLEVRKIYKTLPDPVAEKHQQIRIVDESGEDYLYPQDLFMTLRVSESLEEAFARAA